MANVEYDCQFYACTAACKEHGGRCRQKANPEDPDWFCGTHAHTRDNGGNVEKVGLADMTLVKFKLGPDAASWGWDWPKKFMSVGIFHVSPEQTEAEKQEEIRQRGLETGRQVEGVFGSGRWDDGCPIFGAKGLAHVRMDAIVSELFDAYGGLTALQLIEGPRGNPILQLVFTKAGPLMEVSTKQMEEVNKYLTTRTFGWLAAFHNPRHPAKGVVMTLNADRQENNGRCKALRLHDGQLTVN